MLNKTIHTITYEEKVIKLITSRLPEVKYGVGRNKCLEQEKRKAHWRTISCKTFAERIIT